MRSPPQPARQGAHRPLPRVPVRKPNIQNTPIDRHPVPLPPAGGVPLFPRKKGRPMNNRTFDDPYGRHALPPSPSTERDVVALLILHGRGGIPFDWAYVDETYGGRH